MTESLPKPIDRHLVKLGGSLVVPVPPEIVERWSLDKGDEVRITVLKEGIKIEPKQPTKIETISSEAIAAYSKAIADIQAKVALTGENEIKLEFTGSNQDAVRVFVGKLWQNLPLMLRLLGLGSVEELPRSGAEEQKEA
jgi:antitoxin component of MazEF toxin-antitoxin module